MQVVMADQIRAMDRRAMEEFGIPGVALMENAGRAVVDVIAREYGPLRNKRILVCCGVGNNGGDGFVVARYLHLAGAVVTVFLAGGIEKLKDDARTHFEVMQRLEIGSRGQNGSMPDNGSLQTFDSDDFNGADLVVDALLGTGVKEAPREPYAQAIEAINRSGKPVISVDLPSGLDADTGKTPGAAVRAMHTVTFAYPKLGFYLGSAVDHVGALHLADIGFDWECLKESTSYRLFALPQQSTFGPGTEAVVLTPGNVGLRTAAYLLRKRSADANKGIFGHVAVLAGSQGMAGAPAMVARAAQHSGAGLVTVLTPACAQPTIASKLDEQMTLPLADADGSVDEKAFDAVAQFAEKATVLCIGPGLTTKPGVVALVTRILAEIDRPIVLDADGLNCLASHPDCLNRRKQNPRAPLILTPHPGEAARLLGTSIAEVQADRVKAVRELARRFQAVAILKGRYTLIADLLGDIVINTTGNPGMATGGSGDVLTGVVGGLLAQGIAPGKSATDEATYRATTVDPVDAVALAVYLHGLAGDLAAAQVGEAGLVAGDIIAYLSRARRQLEGQS